MAHWHSDFQQDSWMDRLGLSIALSPLMGPRSFAVAAMWFALVGCGGRAFDDVATPTDGAVSDTSPSLDTGSGSSDSSPTDLTSCTGPNTCSLLPKSCCGGCSGPSVDNMTAVTRGREAEYSKSVCGPDPVGCPECAPAIFDGSVQAWCIKAKCRAIDVRKESVAVCNSDADCMLRHAPCCEGCDENPFDLVALNKAQTSGYRASVCSGDETCSKCLVRYPADASAVCDPATKHCRVKSPMLP